MKKKYLLSLMPEENEESPLHRQYKTVSNAVSMI